MADRPTVVEPAGPAKPRLRGRLHQVAFFVAIPACLMLIAIAPTTKARVATIVYTVGLAGLFGTSAAYHRIPWSPRALRWMKRFDHSMIYLLIAGTYTPIALLVLHGAWSVVMLAIVWTGAVFGIVMKMVRIDGARVLGGILYIGLGWAVVVAMPQMVRWMHPAPLVLMFVGGLLYTLGAIVLLRRRPDPRPAVFGYHEVWHSMTIGAGLCHYLVVLLIVLAAG
jgi:hemolysin III